jgi:large subunit ribosomal protein L21
MYVIFKACGKQYKATEGLELLLDKHNLKEGDSLIIKEVMLLVDQDKVSIGQPYVENCQVSLKVIKHLQGDKIRVARFRAKSRHRRVIGFRADLTKFKVEKISTGKAEKVAEVKPVKKQPVKKTERKAKS